MLVQDDEIKLYLTELYYGDDEALLKDGENKFNLLQDGGLWTSDTLTDFTNFIAYGYFDK